MKKVRLKEPAHPHLAVVEGQLVAEKSAGKRPVLTYPYVDREGKPISARVSSLTKPRGALNEVNRLYRHARLGLLDTSEAARLSAILKVSGDLREQADLEPRLVLLEERITRALELLESRGR